MTSLLIILPRGLGVSGVTTWALRLAGGLASRGRRVGILAPGDSRDRTLIPDGVLAFLHERLPIDNLRGELSPILPAYREAIESMAADGPVVVSPNLHGDCYGAVVEAVRGRDDVRLVGWQHSDIAYDAHVLRWYAPALAHVVGVSGRIVMRLRDEWPATAQRVPVSLIPYGVEVPAALPARPPMQVAASGAPVRLLYAGRLDHEQKRVGALAPMMRELAAAGIAARLTIAGDGPARAELETAFTGCPDVELLGAVPPAHVAALLDTAHCFVLPSRYEGLSVAMLEAMARGCVPIVARVESGLDDAVRDGESALISDVGPDAAADETGRAMVDAIRRALDIGIGRLSAGAHAAAGAFSIERHLDAVEAMLDAAAAAPPPAWPVDRPAAFSAWDPRSGSGSVPAEGPARMAAALDTLAATGARIAIHGTGEHTRQLAGVIEARLDCIACFCDDDPANWGARMLGRPIVAPGAAPEAGATHVVISSWLHETEIWRRRAMYDRQGLSVARLYA